MTSVWGVNTHCDRVSVAVMDVDTRQVLAVATVKAKTGPNMPERRVWELHGVTRALFDSLADDHPPASISIEQPRGVRNGQDVLLAGWTSATIASVQVAERTGGTAVWVEVSTWRRQSALYDRVGAEKGNTLTKRWKSAGLKMAKEHGYQGKSTEESDACVIALAACTTIDSAAVSR